MIPASQTLTNVLREALETLPDAVRSKRLLIACSGGSDSVALAAATHQLGIPFDLAHVNYRLRGKDSTLDQQLVSKLGDKWGAAVHIWTVPDRQWHQGESLQKTARDIRYAFFEELMSKFEYPVCLLAHHEEDQAESILLSLIKGNSYQVLSPIPRDRPGYFRPLLSISKETCRAALREWQIEWREDLTNTKNGYQRNMLRNEVFPLLEQINTSVSQQISKRAAWYEQQMRLLDILLHSHKTKHTTIHNGIHTFFWDSLDKDLLPFLPVFFASVLNDWGWHGYDLWEALDLLPANPGKLHQWNGTLIKGRDLIQWIPDYRTQEPYRIPNPAALPASGQICDRTWTLSLVDPPATFPSGGLTHFLNPDELSWPLTVRQPLTGDKMTPLGLGGQQLLSDVMINQKFRPAQKARAMVLSDEQGIVALSDFRIADRAKLGQTPQSVLSFVIEEAD